jgi:hypothetical protein
MKKKTTFKPGDVVRRYFGNTGRASKRVYTVVHVDDWQVWIVPGTPKVGDTATPFHPGQLQHGPRTGSGRATTK